MTYTEEIRTALGDLAENEKTKFLLNLSTLICKGFLFLTPKGCKEIGIDLRGIR